VRTDCDTLKRMNTSKLAGYIAEQKTVGATDIDIAQALVAAGWMEGDIQKAFRLYQESQKPREQSQGKKQKKSKKKLIAFLVVLFLLVTVAVGGVWAHENNYVDLAVLGLPSTPVSNMQMMLDTFEQDFAEPAFDYLISMEGPGYVGSDLYAEDSLESNFDLLTLKMEGSIDAREGADGLSISMNVTADPDTANEYKFLQADMRYVDLAEMFYVRFGDSELLNTFGLEAITRTWIEFDGNTLDEGAQVLGERGVDALDSEDVLNSAKTSLSDVFTRLAEMESFSAIEVLEPQELSGEMSHRYRVSIDDGAFKESVLTVLRESSPEDTPSEILEDLVFEAESTLRQLTFSSVEVWFGQDSKRLYRFQVPVEYREIGTSDSDSIVMRVDFSNYNNPALVEAPAGQDLDPELVLDYVSNILFGAATVFAGEEIGLELPADDLIDENTDYILSLSGLVESYDIRQQELYGDVIQSSLLIFDEFAYEFFIGEGTFDGLCAEFYGGDGEAELCRSEGQQYVFVPESIDGASYWCTSGEDGPIRIDELPGGFVCQQ